MLALFFTVAGYAQEVPKAQRGAFALTKATIVTVSNGTIENGTLVIGDDGKISALGASVDVPANAQVIDCSGHYIYPGMIDGGTQLGMSEVGSISLTQDYNEIGNVTPQMQALTAVNPNSVAIPVTRVNGVTTVLVAPTGGLFPGTAALIDLVGYTPDQMDAGFRGLAMNFPSSGRSSRWDRRSEEDRKKEEEKALKELNELWDDALLYHRIDSTARVRGETPEYKPELRALLTVLRGEAALLIEADRDEDIRKALRWIKARNIRKPVLTGVAEGWRVAEEIAAAGVPVITGPVLSTPTRASDRYDRPYANAGLMAKAGVLVALRTNDSENVRNLPYNAGFAAAYGMGKEAALRAVTINPAQIFGVADSMGSLETGKDATLFVSTGDPFETKTDFVHLFINGWKIPMDSRHIRLYNEFLERRPGLKD